MNALDSELQQRLESIWRHFRGVKRRLLYVLVAFGVGASLTWSFHETVFGWLLAPARNNLSATGPPIFTSPTEMFGLTVRLSMWGGGVVAFPVLVFHVCRFLSPLFGPQQRRFVALFLPSAFVFYLAGVAFAYFVLLPTGLSFLLRFGTNIATPMIRISEYMDLAKAMIFWLGVVFELPLAMFLLAKLKLVSWQRFKGFRRYVPVTAYILSALITPTFDTVNQTLVAVPIILLFEAGVGLAWLTR